MLSVVNKPIKLNVLMLNVLMLSDVMLRVFKLKVLMLRYEVPKKACSIKAFAAVISLYQQRIVVIITSLVTTSYLIFECH